MNAAPSVNGATGTTVVKSGMAQSLKGGVIMDVMNVEQAKLAEAAQLLLTMRSKIAELKADFMPHTHLADPQTHPQTHPRTHHQQSRPSHQSIPGYLETPVKFPNQSLG